MSQNVWPVVGSQVTETADWESEVLQTKSSSDINKNNKSGKFAILLKTADLKFVSSSVSMI